jgi:hypothetical protein
MEVQKIGFARRAIKADGVGAGIVPIDPQSLTFICLFFYIEAQSLIFIYVKIISCHDAIP